MKQVFQLEPRLDWSDISLAGVSSWEEVDEVAAHWLGRPCVALPSVRVGICWAMELRGFVRHRDHVLVPRFMGRCILNSLSRFALPVEKPSSETRMVLVVDQFGLRQRLDLLTPAFNRNGWVFIEDSPYGVGKSESPAQGSAGRLIGLGKAMPAVLGALLLTEDSELEGFVRKRRAAHSSWSHPVWLTMLALRCGWPAVSFAAADAAYELYPASQGGNRWLRGNIVRVLEQATRFEGETRARVDAAAAAIKPLILWPDLLRVGYVLPCFVGVEQGAAQAAFRRFGFNDAAVHVDVAMNMLEPRYEKSLLLPLNPRIPRDSFDRLLEALSGVALELARTGTPS